MKLRDAYAIRRWYHIYHKSLDSYVWTNSAHADPDDILQNAASDFIWIMSSFLFCKKLLILI